jgi:hypothetical protein
LVREERENQRRRRCQNGIIDKEEIWKFVKFSLSFYKEHFLERQIKLKVELKWAFFVLAFKWFINLTG